MIFEEAYPQMTQMAQIGTEDQKASVKKPAAPSQKTRRESRKTQKVLKFDCGLMILE